MKKVVLMLAVVAMIGSLTSCKKDYACKCTVAGFTVEGATFKDTKKNAEDKCAEGNSSVGGVTSTCEAVKK